MPPPDPHVWPDALDSAAVLSFLAAAIALPALGYVFVVLDVRRYLRSLRRAISTIVFRADRVYGAEATPAWARPQTPRAIAVFGLCWPCSEEEVKQAYRRKIKTLHPDHGGDQRQFLLLQRYFEEALEMARRQDEALDPTAG